MSDNQGGQHLYTVRDGVIERKWFGGYWAVRDALETGEWFEREAQAVAAILFAEVVKLREQLAQVGCSCGGEK
jgi:hypothetical protein